MKQLLTGLLISMFLAVMLSGCSIGTKAIMKTDAALMNMLENDKMGIDCRAGIAAGSIVTPSTSAEVRASAAALQTYANKESNEYKKCFTAAVWVSYLIHGGEDIAARVIAKLGTLGIIAP
jgi:hypothetical protein